MIDIVRPSDRIVTENVTVVQHSVHTDTHCRQSTLTGNHTVLHAPGLAHALAMVLCGLLQIALAT